MRKQWFPAMLALAAIPGLAPGGDESTTPPARLSPSVPTNQAASPYSPASAEPAAPTGSVLDGRLVSDPSGPSARSEAASNPPDCFWVRGEYLLWWIKNSQIPPLITTGAAGATALPGVLGQSDTSVLFGGSGVDNQTREGARVSAGFWLNDSHTVGIEGGYFFLGSRAVRFDDSSTGALGSPVIARPFFDVISGIQNAQLVAFPGIARGEIHVSSSSRLQGAELNLDCCSDCSPCRDACANQACHSAEAAKYNVCHNTCCGCGYSVCLLGGLRYLQLDEGLDSTETSHVNPSLPGGAPLFGGSTITVIDQFDTHNYFYGAQVGARAEFSRGCVFVDVLAKVALGATHEVVDIQGATAITSPTGTTVVTPAGLLALESNSGHFTRDRFAVVPEVGINIGYQITKCLRASVGYTFLYWSAVARPGDQVDLGLSGTRIPTDTRFNPLAAATRPAVLLRDTDFWAQGINFSLEVRY
jgi:hypothetical protein